jgi:hypothetical protein
VIRIRYSSELQPGLNGKAVRVGDTTFVYLLPGLTPAQRTATLRRLRQHGRMGLSPELPAISLCAAVIASRIATTFGNARAIVRVHPAGSTVPVVVVSAAVIGFLLVSTVSIKIIHTPLTTGSGDIGAAHANAPTPGTGAASSHGGLPPGSAVPVSRSPGSNEAGTPTGGTGNSATSPAAPAPTSSGGVPLTSTTATWPPPGQPSPPATPGPSPAASATAGSSPSASPSPAPGGGPPAVTGTTVCVKLGPFGICL